MEVGNKALFGKLSQFERKRFFLSAVENLILSLFVFIIILFVLVLLEAVCYFNPSAKLAIYYSYLFGFLAVLIYKVVFELLKGFFLFNKPDYKNNSIIIGNFYPEIKDRLTNVIELYENRSENCSNELATAAFDDVVKATKNYDFCSLLSFNKLIINSKSKIVVGFLLLLVVLIPNNFSSAIERLNNYSANYAEPDKFSFDIFPGDAKITKGSNLEIKIEIVGIQPEMLVFYKKAQGEFEWSEVKISKTKNDEFSAKFEKLRYSFQYFVQGDEIKSQIYTVAVIDRPLIESFQLNIVPPRYSKLPIVFQKDNGNVNLLKGSRISFELQSTKKLKKASIIVNQEKEINLRVDGKNASGEMIVNGNAEYYFQLVDEESIENVNPVKYFVTALDDQYPEISITIPGKDTKLANNNRLNLTSTIRDDYGFSRATLNFKLSKSDYEEAWKEYRSIELPINKNESEGFIYYNWDISSISLATNDELTYFIEIFDNDNISGPKSTKSAEFKVMVPSIDELFNEINENQDNTGKELTETLKKAEELKKEIDKINNELKKDAKDISFNEKEKIEDVLKQAEKISENLSQMKKEMNQVKNDLQKNELLSEKTLEKYMELQKLFEELNSDELKNAFEQMQKALETMNRNAVQQSFEELKKNEEYMQKSIQRTINLLKRVQVEQMLDEMLKRGEDVKETQNEIKENLEKNTNQNKSNAMQNELTENLEKLAERLDQLKKKIEELKDLPTEQIKKLNEQFKAQSNANLSKNAMKNMQSGNKQGAKENQEKIVQNMENFIEQMEQLQSQMGQEAQLKNLMEMIKITENLLSLSNQEENLKKAITGKLDGTSNSVQKAREQNSLKMLLHNLINQLNELSQKTFSITPELGKTLGNASKEMSSSTNFLEKGSNSQASVTSQNAMKSLNEAVSLMQGAMNNMMNSGGQGEGMMSMMQQMEKLSQQQMSLNEMTRKMQSGGLSMAEQAQMQRLAAEQELIKKSLEQLNRESRESGQSKSVAGNMEKVIDEMQDVIKNLSTQKLDDELIQRQEKILSKMLDIQKSINERDYEDERNATSGKEIKGIAPRELDLKTLEGRNKLRDELLKAVKEGYLKDYENLIKQYFDALQKKEQKK